MSKLSWRLVLRVLFFLILFVSIARLVIQPSPESIIAVMTAIVTLMTSFFIDKGESRHLPRIRPKVGRLVAKIASILPSLVESARRFLAVTISLIVAVVSVIALQPGLLTYPGVVTLSFGLLVMAALLAIKVIVPDANNA